MKNLQKLHVHVHVCAPVKLHMHLIMLMYVFVTSIEIVNVDLKTQNDRNEKTSKVKHEKFLYKGDYIIITVDIVIL